MNIQRKVRGKPGPMASYDFSYQTSNTSRRVRGRRKKKEEEEEGSTRRAVELESPFPLRVIRYSRKFRVFH